MNIRNFILSLLLLCSLTAIGQINQGGTPMGLSFSKSTLENIPKVKTPVLDMAAIIAEDAEDEANNVPSRFGYAHEVDYGLQNAGKWTVLDDGSRLWQLKISVPNARSINLNYSMFYMPIGAKMFVYNETGTQVLGAFTEQNNKDHQTFSTGILTSASCIIEYFEPADKIGEGKLQISSIVEGYRYIPGDNFKAYGSSGSCNVDVNCPLGDAWQDEVQGVAMILLDNGTRWCSGSLVNNTALDCKPYFLTANHCLTSGVDDWIFMFNYNSPSCDGPDGPTTQSVQGCTLLASAGSSDFALLELDDNPQDFYNVYFNGWDRGNTAAAAVVGIHHPAGDVKKISFENDPVSSTSYSSSSTGASLTHWRVADWDDGTTEGGSSGSPLFTQDTRRIIGQLHGGGAACSGNSNNGQADWYGKIWYSWDQNGTTTTNSLQSWLDPTGSGASFVDGAINPCAPTVPDNAAVVGTSQPAGTICDAITSIIPEITIRNFGTNNLTAVTITFDIDGANAQSINWTGNLATNATEVVILNNINLPTGMHAFNVSLSNPNGTTDNDLSNNNLTSAYNLIGASIDCYCTSQGNTTQDEWIQSITLGSFTNNSGDNGGYQDFTNLMATFDPGNTYSISLVPGYTSTNYQEYWRIWIDFNSDGDFDDANEMVYDQGSTSNTTVTGNFTIPANVANSNTFMRVTMSYNGAEANCGSFTYGEVEDYSVQIGSSCPDADNDNVCDIDDLCPGGDDGIDINNNNIPDDCDVSFVALKVLLEGAYDVTTGNMRTLLSENGLLPFSQPYNNNIYNYSGAESITVAPSNMVDWVLVEARVGLNPTDKIESKAGILLSNGDIKSTDGVTDLSFNLPMNSNLYFVVRHRNHLDVMIANSLSRTLNMSYDLTTAESQAYGSSQLKMMNGAAVMFAADITQDHTIQVTDFDFWSINAAQLNVYLLQDVNLDGQVQTSDYDLWFDNNAKLSPSEIGY